MGGRGGGPGGCCGGLCGAAGGGGGGGGAPPPPPAPSTLVPSPPGPGSSALRHCPSGCVRAGGSRREDSVTPDQLMLPDCNWSWVTGPYLCTISAADRLNRTYAFPPSLFGCRPGFYLHLHLPSHHLCFVIQAGVGKFSDVLSTLLSPWALSSCGPLGKPCGPLSLPPFSHL